MRSHQLINLLVFIVVASCTQSTEPRGADVLGPAQPAGEAAAAKPGSGGGGTGTIGQPLGTTSGSKAYAVNATYAVGRDGTPRALAWTAGGTAIPLPVDASITSSTASGINQTDVIVGSAGSSAAVWQPIGAGSWASASPLPNPAGSWVSSWAYAINDQGQIAGT